MTGPVLRAEGLGKRFGATIALADVSFDLHPGETLGLLGENGAGKSTLLKILAGVHRADAGRVTLRGVPFAPVSPAAAAVAGVALVPQELRVVPSLTVAENVLLGHLPRGRFGMLDRRALRLRAREVLDRLGATLDPDEPLRDLSFAARQVVALARGLAACGRDAAVLILDEPTAALDDAEAARLFAVVDRLKAEGLGVIHVTHRLPEVARVASRCLVLRDGRAVAEHPGGDRLDLARVVVDMTGPVARREERPRPVPGAPVLELPVADGTVAARGGAILALTGLLGAGAEAAVARRFGAGAGAATTPARAVAEGLGYVSGERARLLFPALTVAENIVLPHLGAGPDRPRRFDRRLTAAVASLLARLGVRPPDPGARAGRLSGGNQQKVLLARWLLGRRVALLLHEPTAGVDVAAKARLHEAVEDLAASGAAIVLAGTDLPEILHLADEIVALRRGGAVAGRQSRPDFDEPALRAMMGA